MPLVPLTSPQLELLLTLARVNRDLLDQRIIRSFGLRETGPYGRVPNERDLGMMRELELTVATIKVLEEAR